MPETVIAALLQRIRRLQRNERIVLVHASAIGQRFNLALLAAATMWPADRILVALDHACTLQLIAPESADGNWYSFRHALVRRAAYQEFGATRVRPIHARIARAIERGAGSDDSSLGDLAYHSWAAADAARCVRYNELAGDRAVAAFAVEDAKAYYTRARAFLSRNSKGYRRLTSKLRALHADAAQTPGIEMRGRQSLKRRDPSARPMPPVRWTPR
jgi:predicted ATPase